MRFEIDTRDPHAGQPVLTEGPPPADARLTLVLIHGRGASARDILALARELRLRDVAYVAPDAGGSSWYPYSFLAPLDQNEPGVSSAFRVLASLIDTLSVQGVDTSRVGLLAFSQGACLTLEFAARHATRCAGLFALSGGLIGPQGTPRNYSGSFEGTPVFLGCSDSDPHVPLDRVHESADVFKRMNATVDERTYPRMGHTVNEDEIAAIRQAIS
jgi:predicted esterase